MCHCAGHSKSFPRKENYTLESGDRGNIDG